MLVISALPIVPYIIGAKYLPSKGIKPFRAVGIKPQRREEIRRLKRELEVVRQERDILKKVVSIYSRESR